VHDVTVVSAALVAFSSEVDTGSREETASKRKAQRRGWAVR
jgi:hypothetical protein